MPFKNIDDIFVLSFIWLWMFLCVKKGTTGIEREDRGVVQELEDLEVSKWADSEVRWKNLIIFYKNIFHVF